MNKPEISLVITPNQVALSDWSMTIAKDAGDEVAVTSDIGWVFDEEAPLGGTAAVSRPDAKESGFCCRR